MRRTRTRRAGKRSKKGRRTRNRRMRRGCGCGCKRCTCRSKKRQRCKCGCKRCKDHSKKTRGGGRWRRGVMRGGGYYQYLSNTPFSAGQQTPASGAYLKGSESALANPVTFDRTMNCVDNYNHYTGTGSPSV